MHDKPASYFLIRSELNTILKDIYIEIFTTRWKGNTHEVEFRGHFTPLFDKYTFTNRE